MKTTRKFVYLMPLALLLMSAQQKSCSQPEGRTLKKIVQVSGIDAAPILIADQSFDYKYVSNQQFPGVVFDTGHFYVRARMPGQTLSAASQVLAGNGDSAYFGVSKMVDKMADDKSLAQLKAWYPQKSVEDFLVGPEASCLLSRPQYQLFGSINAMELWGGGKLQVGFNQNGPALPLSASVAIDTARMALSMVAKNPLTKEVVRSVNASAKKTDVSFKIGFDLGPFHIGPEFYKNTGMSQVTEEGLKNAVNAIHSGTQNDSWFTRVFQNMDREVIIVGSSELNLKVGDQLKVVNESHVWQGTPCDPRSIYEGSFPTDREWTVEVTVLGDGFSRAKVLQLREDANIEAGAKVTLLHLVEDLQAAKGSKASSEAASGSNSDASAGQKVDSSGGSNQGSNSNVIGTRR